MKELVETTVAECRESARRVERAAQTLGPRWPGYSEVMEHCDRFRQRCDEMVSGRGFEMITVAFIGPKKAGKSTLIQLLLKDKNVRSQVVAGSSLNKSTEKLIWIGEKAPVGMDHSVEYHIPCPEAGMPELGVPCVIADVPGDNENGSAREMAAHRALDLALVKVLVFEFTDRRNEEIYKLLKRAGKSLIIPVITKIRPTDDIGELVDLRSTLASIAPEANILEPLRSIEFDHKDTERDYSEKFASQLKEGLARALVEHKREPLLREFITGERFRFEEESQKIARHHLRSSYPAVERFRNATNKSLRMATADLLGSDRELKSGIRWSLRMALIERSPACCFPWRPFLTLASLSAGAVDRIPLALVGSIPSLGSIIYGAARNVKDGASFQKAASEGLKSRLTRDLQSGLREHFRDLDDAIRIDLGDTSDVATGDCATFEPTGIDKLQADSKEQFQAVIEIHAPGRKIALIAALVGFVIFWTVFGWPLSALYQDIVRGAQAVMENKTDAESLFPQGAGSVLVTSAFLGIIPMFLFLLGSLGWMIRSEIVDRCLLALRGGHEKLCADLINKGGIAVTISEPKLDACRTLLVGKK